MSAYAPPTSSSGQSLSSRNTFNATDFQSNLGTTALTQSSGDGRYLRQMGGSLSGALTVKGGLTVSGTTLVANNGLTVKGNSSMTGNVAVTGNSSMTGNVAVIGNLAVSGFTNIVGSLTMQNNTFLPLYSATSVAPIAGQLGFQPSTTILGTSTLLGGNTVSEASISIPYGTYMVYGQVSVSNTNTAIAPATPLSGTINLFTISISSTTAVDKTKQGTMVNIILAAGVSNAVTQNMTTIITNYTNASVTYNLLTKLTVASGSYSTNPDLAVLTAVRIA
jgi:hypothetical protein